MNKFNFAEVILNIKKTDIALPLANIAKNDFLNNFKVQGFGGNKWKEVERRTEGTNAYKYPKNKGLSRHTKPILTGTGRLRRDVANAVSSGRKNSPLSYTLSVNNPYAEIHNDGGTINKKGGIRSMNFHISKSGASKFSTKKKANFQQDVSIGAHSVTIPQRQFVGTTPELNKKLLNRVMQEFNKVW